MTSQAVGLSSKGADFNDSMYATPLNSAHAVGKFRVYEGDGRPRHSLSVSLSDRWITDHREGKEGSAGKREKHRRSQELQHNNGFISASLLVHCLTCGICTRRDVSRVTTSAAPSSISIIHVLSQHFAL